MSYWRNRELEHINQRKKYDKLVSRRLARNYKNGIDEIDEQIAAFLGRYADKEGMTIEQVKKRASKLDIEKYKRKAKKYVKEKNFSPQANAEMRIYNLTMKVNRLELLKENIRLELIAMTSEEERIMYEALRQGVIDEYKRQSAILGESIHYTEKSVQAIVNSSFLTATWSDRIWSNQQALRAEIEKLINRGVLQGKGSRELARDLRKVFDVSVYNSERIIRTEMAHAQTEVFFSSADEVGIESYEWIAEDDDRVCEECKAMDGKKITKEQRKDMDLVPPKHPNCRCALALNPTEARRKLDESLTARGL